MLSSARTRRLKFLVVALASAGSVGGWLRAAEAIPAVPAAVASNATASAWTAYPLGQSGDLQALVRVKSPVSIADQDWLEVVIINSGPAATIASGAIKGGAVWDTHSAGDLLSGLTLGVSTGARAARSKGNELPAGRFTTLEPGGRMAASFGPLPAGEKVSLTITLDLQLTDGRAFSGSATAATVWAAPDAAEIATMQKEMGDLLELSTAGPVRPYNDTRSAPPPRLSGPQSERLGLLLSNPDVVKVLTVEQTLTMIKVHQLEGTLPNNASPAGGLGTLLQVVDKRWSRDPAVIAFFRDALATRGGEAIRDLQSLRNVWDDTFVEALVKDFESTAPSVARGRASQPRLPVAEEPSIIFSGALDLLSKHYSAWAKDTSIPPRLSKAVLTAYPALSGAPGAGSAGGWTYALGMLALTRDRSMITVLRPFLADKTPVSQIDRGTPLRVSELASNAILQLLGDPPRYGGGESGIGPSAYPGPHPLWDLWDKQIGELEKRLDTLSKN